MSDHPLGRCALQSTSSAPQLACGMIMLIPISRAQGAHDNLQLTLPSVPRINCPRGTSFACICELF